MLSPPTSSTQLNPAPQPCIGRDDPQAHFDTVQRSLDSLERNHATSVADLKQQLASLQSSTQTETQVDEGDVTAQLRGQIQTLLQQNEVLELRACDAERGLEMQKGRLVVLETRHNDKAQAQKYLLKNMTKKFEAL